jgi:hypothetical protein
MTKDKEFSGPNNMAEIFTLGGIAAAGAFGEKLYEKYKSQLPLCCIQNSYFDKKTNKYRVILTFNNFRNHGTYLELVKLILPQKTEFSITEILEKRATGINNGGSTPAVNYSNYDQIS